jgi:hypothetical protein
MWDKRLSNPSINLPSTCAGDNHAEKHSLFEVPKGNLGMGLT